MNSLLKNKNIPPDRNQKILTFVCLCLLFMCACVHVLVIYCIGFYLWNEETQWAGLTLGLFLPGTAVQLLSMKWYCDDGDDRRCYLSVIHILHLGIFKR